MKILGIDPGMAIVGYGLIEEDINNNFKLLASGSIQTDKKLEDSKRLLEIYKDLSTIVEEYKPDCASVEQLFFFKNQKTVIPVAEARGVILTVLEKYEIPFFMDIHGDNPAGYAFPADFGCRYDTFNHVCIFQRP